MGLQYQVDYTKHDTPDKVQRESILPLPASRRLAVKHSKDPEIGMAYIVAYDGGQSVGHIVYANGSYSHTEGTVR